MDTNDGAAAQVEQGETLSAQAQVMMAPDQPRMTPSTDLSMVRAVSPFNEVTTRVILRQIEFYFSDQNLPSDRHLLSLADGTGNGEVSLNRICGFKKMRSFKPRSMIVEVLRQSAVLDIVGKNVKRRFPLTMKLLVEPEIDSQRDHVERTLADNPHLTKAMIKPTGFETDFVHFPLTPAEHARNLKLYDPEFSFWTRIETAIGHFCSKRKMHQKYQRVFSLWMDYGGIANGPSPFTSGNINDDDLDKDDIIQAKCQFTVDRLVIEEEDKWEVDFEGTALGFLSTEFTTYCDWDNAEEVDNVCNVMKNFFRFLLHHEVCPEYAQQLRSACLAIDRAAVELHTLPRADKALRHPRSFNNACKVLADGSAPPMSFSVAAWDDMRSASDDELRYLGRDDALSIFYASITAFDVLKKLDVTTQSRCDVLANKSTITETIGLEIVSMELVEGHRASFFATMEDTIVPRMGLLRCKYWKMPYEPVYDRLQKSKDTAKTFEFIVNEDALTLCSVGMKLDAQIKSTETGLSWIDELYNLHPSFYRWLPNVRLSEIKQRVKDQTELQEFLHNNKAWSQDSSGVVRMVNGGAGMAVSTVMT